ncbi:MAG: glycosyltransferase family 2 protein [Sulfurovum sp.]|nr:glycosyltransferase family 2 protein [Sulfurovum sp.]
MNTGSALSPLVSVLIPLYNAEQYLSECLDSVINQTYKNIEIIIVNDGSTDNSLSIAESYAKQYSCIKVYSQENSGASSARNKAFSFSKGDYIQYFDADDIMDKNKIALQIDALRELYFDPGTASICKWAKFHLTVNNAIFIQNITYKNYDKSLDYLIDCWSNFQCVVGTAWLIPRTLHKKVGSWDTALSVHDDYLFFAKVAYFSDKIIHVKNSVVYWRQDNMQSLSKTLTWEGMHSHLNVCHGLYKLVKNDLAIDGMKYALAMEYSKLIFRAYPAYMDLVKEAEKILNHLGYDKPLPMPTRKFRLSEKLIGFYPSARIFGMKDKIMKRLRGIRG